MVDFLHPDSELAPLARELKPDEYTKLWAKHMGNPYSFCLELVRRGEIVIPKERISSFLLINRGLTVSAVDLPKDIDPAELMFRLEERTSTRPIGRPWENSPVSADRTAATRLVVVNELKKKRDFQAAFRRSVIIRTDPLVLSTATVQDQIKRNIEQYNPKDSALKAWAAGLVNDAPSVFEAELLRDFLAGRKVAVKAAVKAIETLQYDMSFLPRDPGVYNFREIEISRVFTNPATSFAECELRFRFNGTEFGRLFNFFCRSTVYRVYNCKSTVLSDRVGDTILRMTLYDEPAVVRRPHVQTKRQLRYFRVDPWEIGVSAAEETTIPQVPPGQKWTRRRIKNTFRIYATQRSSPIALFELSLSAVLTGDNTVPEFEVELERRHTFPVYAFGAETMYNAILFLFQVAQDTSTPVSPGYTKSLIRQLSSKAHRSVNVIPFNPYKRSAAVSFASKTWYMSKKLDGEHHRLAIHPAFGIILVSNDDCVTVVSPPFRLSPDVSAAQSNNPDVVVLDVELTTPAASKEEQHYIVHVYDIIKDSLNSQELDFVHRLEAVKTWVKILTDANENKQYKYKAKPFQRILAGLDGDNVLRLIENTRTDTFADGIIFQPNEGSYSKSVPLKWKDKYNNTIDVLVRPYNDYPESTPLPPPPTNDLIERINGNLDYTYFMKRFHSPINLGLFVVEVMYDPSTSKFVVYRQRFAKRTGNSLPVVQSNMELMSSPAIGLKLFGGRGIVIARKLVNELKVRLIAESSVTGSVMIDVGTGQGGDYQKWARFSSILCIERNEDMLLKFSKRWSEDPGYKRIEIQHDSFESAKVLEHFIAPSLMTIFFSTNTIGSSESIRRFANKILAYKPMTVYVLYMESHLMAQAHDGKNIIVLDKQDHFETTIPETEVVKVVDAKTDGKLMVRGFNKILGKTYKITRVPAFFGGENAGLGMMPTIYPQSMPRADHAWLRAVFLVELKRWDIIGGTAAAETDDDDQPEYIRLDQVEAQEEERFPPEDDEPDVVIEYEEEEEEKEPRQSSSDDDDDQEPDVEKKKKTKKKKAVSDEDVVRMRRMTQAEIDRTESACDRHDPYQLFGWTTSEFWVATYALGALPDVSKSVMYSDLPAKTFYLQNFLNSEIKFGRQMTLEQVLRSGPPKDAGVEHNALFVGSRPTNNHGRFIFIPPGGGDELTEDDIKVLSSYNSVTVIVDKEVFPFPSLLCQDRVFPSIENRVRVLSLLKKLSREVDKVKYNPEAFVNILGKFERMITIKKSGMFKDDRLVGDKRPVENSLNCIIRLSKFGTRLTKNKKEAALVRTDEKDVFKAYKTFCAEYHISPNARTVSSALDVHHAGGGGDGYAVYYNEAKPLNSRIRRVTTLGDGTCLFQAVLITINRGQPPTRDEIEQLRYQCLKVAEVLIDEGKLKNVFPDTREAKLKLSRLARSWKTDDIMDHMMVNFLALVLDRPILVVMDEKTIVRVGTLEFASVSNINTPIVISHTQSPAHYEGTLVDPDFPALAVSEQLINSNTGGAKLSNFDYIVNQSDPDLQGVIYDVISGNKRKTARCAFKYQNFWFKTVVEDGSLKLKRFRQNELLSKEGNIPSMLFYSW